MLLGVDGFDKKNLFGRRQGGWKHGRHGHFESGDLNTFPNIDVVYVNLITLSMWEEIV